MPSDYGHEQTDKLLKELENRIDKEYSQAAKEVQEKFYAHMKDFERKDAKMQEKLDAGKITETEYQNWRTNQMLTGQRMNALYESLAKDLVNADQIAAGMINDSLPDVYALNMNYSTYKIEHTTEIDTNFTLYDRKTVENLMKDNPRIIPHLTEKQAARIKKDELWNRQHLVSAVAQGILQGEGIPDIAKRLQTVAAMDDNAATRNARTYITAAQNKGRIDSYERAEKLGIKTNKKWIATLDDRTRVEHRHLDGVSIPYSDVFKMDGYEIEYPGDPSAEPEMIYNCRCTLVDDILDWPYNDERNDEKLGDMTYEEWKHAKDKPGKEGTTKQDAEIKAEQTKAQAQEETKEFEFTPAKTIGEAEEYAKQFAENVSYKGISVANANIINEQLSVLTNKYPINKLETIQQKRGGAIMVANYRNLGINGSKLGKTINENFEKFLQGKETAKKEKEWWLSKYSDKGKIPKDIQRLINKLDYKQNFERWSVLDSYEDKIKVALTHEYGHILADQYFGQINYERANPNYANMDVREINQRWDEIYKTAKENGDIFKMSEYGSTHKDEYFAECFAAREFGEELPDYVESFFKEVLDRGIM